MNASELSEFVARVRNLFRGELNSTDEEIFALAKARIAGLRFRVAMVALDDYALMHGGSRGRFIPGKFFEFYSRHSAEDVDRRAPTVAARMEKSEFDRQLERDEVYDDWRQRRLEVAALEPSVRSAIVSDLISSGWSRPAASLEAWSLPWILAVADIGTGRRPMSRNPVSGNYDLPTDPVAFYRRTGAASTIAVGAVPSGESRKTGASLQGRSVDPARFPGLQAGQTVPEDESPEIPF